MPLAPAPVSAAPPVPPKLGRPEDPTEKPEDTGKPLTPAEIEANKKKDQITDELRASNQAALSDYSFQAGSMHDPFMPIETVARPPASDPKSTEVKPVLQQMALSQFTLTAIVLKDDPSQSMAMVDSGGKGYIIYLGTLIGNNNGVVKEITTNKVIIEEPEPSYRTGGAARRTELRLTTAQDNEGIEFSIDGQ
jgi:type IV pilus assembly protein PilP